MAIHPERFSQYGSIAEPQADIQSLFTTCRDLKRVVEMVVGIQAGGAHKMARISVNRLPPDNPSVGDFWVKQAEQAGELNILSYYFAGKWVKLVEGP